MRYRVHLGWGDGQTLVALVQASSEPHARAMAKRLLARIDIQGIEPEPTAPPPRATDDDHSRWRRPSMS